jgi:hypothetical protein
MKYEYLTVVLLRDNLQADLNRYGKDGWELVGIVDYTSMQHTYIFKRGKK